MASKSKDTKKEISDFIFRNQEEITKSLWVCFVGVVFVLFIAFCAYCGKTANIERMEDIEQILRNNPKVTVDGVEVVPENVHYEWYENYFYDEEANILFLKSSRR